LHWKNKLHSHTDFKRGGIVEHFPIIGASCMKEFTQSLCFVSYIFKAFLKALKTFADIIIIIIIIIIFSTCNWVVTRWQWLFYRYTKHEIGFYWILVGRATWEACSGNLKSWEPSEHLLLGTGKPRKACVEVAGRRTFRILTSSQQSGI